VIHYITGDATDPKVPGHRVIVHVCNDLGGWGSGFVLSVSKRWAQPEAQYRQLRHQLELEPDETIPLGTVQIVRVSDDTEVANMVAQRGYRPQGGIPAIRYNFLEECLRDVLRHVKDDLGSASVHMPRIGCGLAGGKWSEVEPIVNRVLAQNNVPTYVYDFDTRDARTVPWNK
jgi:O-acetyl-ADP-ribose deacetylase (regulator of RNase III)